MTRKILHIDMDAFYASVEQRDDPALRGKPVLVGGSGPRSVVCAASYEARRFKVRSAMPMSRAIRLCPEAIIVPPHFDQYREVSRQIREIFERHTPLVEPISLDEAYLDVTAELTGIPTATETAQIIRTEIRRETGLTASAGVSVNKFLAKIASDWRKPDGLFVIKPHAVSTFLPPIPVVRLPGVGPATERQLIEIGVVKVGDLLPFSREDLRQKLGRFGDRLWELARGIDDRPVQPHGPAKSVSSENTFSTDLTLEEIIPHMRKEAESVWNSIAKKGRQARTVTVKLRNAEFRTLTRRETVPSPLASCDDLEAAARRLLTRFDFAGTDRYRLVGVGVSNFTDEREHEEAEEDVLALPFSGASSSRSSE